MAISGFGDVPVSKVRPASRVQAAAFVLNLLLFAGLASTSLSAQNSGSQVQDGIPIEQILVVGLNRVQEPVVLRQMKSRVGGFYSASNVATDRERLDRMGLFTGIEIEASPGATGVILRVNLKETTPYFPYPAISVTAEQGVTAGIGLKSPNFLSSGNSMSVAGRFGGALEFEVLASSAWKPAKSLWWKSEYFLRDRWNELDQFHEFSNELDWQTGLQLTDKLRVGGRFHFLSVKSDEPGITFSSENIDLIPGFAAVAEYDSRDSWTYAKRGWWNSVDAMANHVNVDIDYWTFNFDVRRYQPISGRHSLAVFSLLTLQTGTVGRDIPIHEDFHIGGTNSLRGWEIDARHGKNQWLNSLEYRFDLLKVRSHSYKGFNYYYGVQLAAFGDTGSAWNVNGEFTKNFIAGGGFGIRLIVPYVNVIRVDFGFGQANRGMISHFGILEKAVYERRRVR